MSIASPFPAAARLKKPVCVFCGSSPGTSAIYTRAAESVGEALAKEGIPVVYGGGRRGIMGVVSKATLQAGGYVHGIMPRALLSRASEHTPAPEASSFTLPQSGKLTSEEGVGADILGDDHDGRLTMDMVGSMHERKLKMAQISTGGFIVLPGGYGTYEEMMEMITWNQLGIHRLPIIVLNIGNFYTPVRALLDNGVKAGFIQDENLSLLRIVDLGHDTAANLDPSRMSEWGPLALQALKEWSFASGAGYGFNWQNDKEGTDEGEALTSDAYPALFTTLRYTSPSLHQATIPINRSDIPLLDRHIDRLRAAHSHFSDRDGEGIWGQWVGDEMVWDILKAKLEVVEAKEQGDWRVRILVQPGQCVEVQVVPAPAGAGAGAGPFQYLPSPTRPETRRPVILDPETTHPSTETAKERDFRLYKTVKRDIYDAATLRGASMSPPPEVLLHTPTHLLETTTSNIALHMPSLGPDCPQWVTPKLDQEHLPFLDGVMRRYLIDEGVVREGEVTVEDWEDARKGGRRVVGFNGLRGVWEADPR